jgi:predicted phage terminase large subunit-like protein
VIDLSDIDLLTPQEQAELLAGLEQLVGGEGAAEFIARVFPHEPVPKHLMPVVRAVERARVQPIRLCISVGPGHAKTTILLRLLVWWLSKSLADQCAYVTYSNAQAMDKSGRAREYAEDAGIKLTNEAVGHWLTIYRGGLIAAGARGKLTGQRVPGLIIYDDPYKDEFEARSPLINNAVKERFKSIAFTRLQGGSIIVLHTRWSEDDLIGWLTKELGWEYINIPTVCESTDDILGRAMDEVAWPEKYPYERCSGPCAHDGHLIEIRETIGEHLWASMYQGRPRPLGRAVFHEPGRYERDTFDWTGKRGVIAIDPAATVKTSSDYSVLAVCAMDGFGALSKMYIVDVIRTQVEIPELVDIARKLQLRYRLMVACEAIGGFKAVPQSLRRMDPTLRVIDIVIAMRDKLTRALPMSAAWNSGRVLVPLDAPWADRFIDEHRLFTGAGDKHDDQVDATAHAWNVLYRGVPKITGDNYAAGGI